MGSPLPFAAASSAVGSAGQPFPILITLAFPGTLVASRLALKLGLPAVLGALLLGLVLHPSQDMLSLHERENLDLVSLSMLLFCAGLHAELHQRRGLLRFGVLPGVGGVVISSLLFGGLIDPSSLTGAQRPALLAAAGLMLIARPLRVLALQRFSPFDRRHGLLLAWCGLRGAVPLALSFTAIHTLPLVPGLGGPGLEGIARQLQRLSLPPLCVRLALAQEEA